ncbi:hypothetical protein BDV97DRAFT_33371 [Delphinella strobiligena]|nr:hypothetical protein BDV97DRAFT_33371 [Delphinella strobiligena]
METGDPAGLFHPRLRSIIKSQHIANNSDVFVTTLVSILIESLGKTHSSKILLSYIIVWSTITLLVTFHSHTASMNNQLRLPEWHIEQDPPFQPAFQAMPPQPRANKNEERPNAQRRRSRQLSAGTKPLRPMPPGQMPPGPMPPGHMPPGHMPLGHMPFGQMQHMPLGQMPLGQTPNEQLLNDLIPNGQMPGGHMPFGQMFNEQLSASPILNSPIPNGQMPDGHVSHGQMPNRPHMLNGQMTNRQMPIMSDHSFVGRDDGLPQWGNTTGVAVDFGVPQSQHMMPPFTFDCKFIS